MNTRFPILSILSTILKVVGILLIIGAFIGLIIQDQDAIYRLVGVLSLVLGIIVCVIGEIIGVAFAIEDNTRKIVELLQKTIPSSDAQNHGTSSSVSVDKISPPKAPKQNWWE